MLDREQVPAGLDQEALGGVRIGGNNNNHIDVAGEHAAEEDSDYDESPYSTSDEGLLLLFELRDSRLLCGENLASNIRDRHIKDT